MKSFAESVLRYFAGVEAEVVKLALAIAARVLHREAKLDPLLLTGCCEGCIGEGGGGQCDGLASTCKRDRDVERGFCGELRVFAADRGR